MRLERNETLDASNKEREKHLFYLVESYRDFCEWLFEVSEHCNHIPLREAWEEFEKYQESLTDKA